MLALLVVLVLSRLLILVVLLLVVVGMTLIVLIVRVGGLGMMPIAIVVMALRLARHCDGEPTSVRLPLPVSPSAGSTIDAPHPEGWLTSDLFHQSPILF